MGFKGWIAAQLKGIRVSWRPLLLHVSAYAVLCLVLNVAFGASDVWQYIYRMVLVILVAYVMIQKGGIVARLLWLGVAIGETGWLVSHCATLAWPETPTSSVQLVYAGLLLTLFVLLSRSGGDGGIRTLTPAQPLTPPRTPAGVR